RRNLAIGFVEQGQAWLYTDLPSMDDRTIGYSVRPALEARAAANQIHFMAHDSVYHDQFMYAKGGVVQFGHTRILVYDGNRRYNGRLSVDVVIIRDNPQGSLDTLLDSVDCGQLILDGSNYNSTIAR